jgi:type I restriction enzyme S subunit
MKNKSLQNSSRKVKFGEVVRLSKARCANPLAEGYERFVGLEHLEPGDLRIRTWGNVADGTTFTSVFKPGQVLFGKRRAYQRKVAMADFTGVCSGDIYVLETQETNMLLPALLPFICQTDAFFEHAVGTSAGSLSPRTNWSSLADFEFSLPSLDGQHRLVNLFSALDEQIQALEAAHSSALVLKSSLAESTFPVSEVKNYLNDPTQYGGRYLVPIEQLTTFQVGYPFKSAQYSSQGDRLLRGSNVGVNRLNWESEVTCYWPTERRAEASDYVLVAGDIVIAMDRPFISEGFKVARITEDDLPALLLQRVGRFKIGKKIEANYLWAFLHSESFKWQLQRMQKGTDLPHISKFDIEGTLIPQLTVNEQAEIAKCFSEIDSATVVLEARIAATRTQRQIAFHSALSMEA